MLVLKNVVKNYFIADTKVEALKGVSIEFRKNEFVAILGQSGCGKTTLLNIVGGLDRYDEGDLSVNGVSTKEFRDSDWDAYRNRSIGFVFQTYNLIPHQTVLSNVELALTLSGVSKAERKQRAKDVLKRVGLEDQINKKPNQMSGGQMQRVAIARALVNDPEILLADEPTGALDSETSLQIMDILKEIARDRLVIMVTHNPDLAEKYATRTVRLLDGKVISDTDPYTAETIKTASEKKKEKKKMKKTSMSFFTALSLSLNNLMTKKTRTFMTSFAGSIGIIGIALIMALSSGIQGYITRMEEETLTSYPLSIEEVSMDLSAMMNAISGSQENEITHGKDKVYSNDMMARLLTSMLQEIAKNDMKAFKEFIEKDSNGIKALTNDIQYSYSTQMNIYKSDTSSGIVQISPDTLIKQLGFGQGNNDMMMSGMAGMNGMSVWKQLMGKQSVVQSQYEVVAGKLPENYDEIVIIVDENNEINDYTLYSLGLKNVDDLIQMLQDFRDVKEIDETKQINYTYDELLKLTFSLVLNSDYFEQINDNMWVDKSEDTAYLKNIIDTKSIPVKVVGILRPSDDALSINERGSVGYTAELTKFLVNKVNDSEVAAAQKANPGIDIFTGTPFNKGGANAAFDLEKLTDEQKAYYVSLDEAGKAAFVEKYIEAMKATYETNLLKIGVADLENPQQINIFPKDFESKDKIVEIIDNYNKDMTDSGNDANVIQYTDYVGLMMSSISSIIQTISYVLIAFVAISLIVSSIMIGIITYISVLERTKEIGVLRSIGASKKDVSRVFNAETLIVGFVAGMLGILVTVLLCIPINLIIGAIADIYGIAALPFIGAVVLILISMLLTSIAGLIPSRVAAKKDPVVALRTE